MTVSVPGQLSRTEYLSLLSLTIACIGILANTFQGDGEPLIASIAFSGIAFSFTYALIRWLGSTFMKAGFKGKDLCKTRTDPMYAILNLHAAFESGRSWLIASAAQSGDDGRGVRCRVLTHNHCIHTISLLQGYCGRHIRRREQRFGDRSPASGDGQTLAQVPS